MCVFNVPVMCVQWSACVAHSVRDASGVAQWEAPNLDACKSQSPSDTTQRLKELNNTRINSSELSFSCL